MSYDAAYLAASMIERGHPEVRCILNRRHFYTSEGKTCIDIMNEDRTELLDVCTTYEYAIHLFRGKAMI